MTTRGRSGYEMAIPEWMAHFIKDTGKATAALLVAWNLSPLFMPQITPTLYAAEEKVSVIINKIDPRAKSAPKRIWDIVIDASDRHGVDPYLITSIIRYESNGDESIVSKKGAVGLMQPLPSSARLSKNDLTDPVKNIDSGTKLIKEELNYWKGDLDKALASYNAGRRKVKDNGDLPPRYTLGYRTHIEEHYKQMLRAASACGAGSYSDPGTKADDARVNFDRCVENSPELKEKSKSLMERLFAPIPPRTQAKKKVAVAR